MERKASLASLAGVLVIALAGCMTASSDRGVRTELESLAAAGAPPAARVVPATPVPPPGNGRQKAAGSAVRRAGPSRRGAQDEAGQQLSVREVRYQPGPARGTGEVRIALSRSPATLNHFTLSSPPRIVLDLAGPVPPGAGQVRFPLSGGQVERARAAPRGKGLRLVLDLKGHLPVYRVEERGRELVVALAARGGEARRGDRALKGSRDRARAGARSDERPPLATLASAVAPAPPRRAAAGRRRGPQVEEGGDASRSRPRRRRPRFSGRPISLDFKDADVQNVLRVLADFSGLNIVATEDVKGKVTLHLAQVPWDQALDVVLRAGRLEMIREGNVIRISTVERLKEEREARRAADEAARELEPLVVRYVRVNYARADEALVDKVKGVLSPRGSASFDERTNTVIVRDTAAAAEQAVDLIHHLDAQSPQVLIEANIVEATEDFARGLGIQWGYSQRFGPQTANPTGLNFPGTVGIGGSGLGTGTPPPPGAANTLQVPLPFIADFPVPSSFAQGFGGGTSPGSALDLALGSIDGSRTLSARLTALEREGKARIISRPRVITMNNVAATIQSLTILRVKLPSTGTVINTGAGGAAGTASTATEKINTGISLVVTPQVSADGYVLLTIYAKSSTPDFSREVDGIPAEVSREANSNVLIANGRTVVLGGIFRSLAQANQNGIPYLRHIPVLGWLFRNDLRTRNREELLVFITPRVLTPGTAPLPTARRLWEERPAS